MIRLEGEGWTLDIPDKRYFTPREVAQLCQVQTQVLRSWERLFPQLQPVQRNGRRYYRQRDLKLVMEIHVLLREKGLTLTRARQVLEAAGWRSPETEDRRSEADLQAHVAALHTALVSFDSWLKANAIRGQS